MATIEFQPRTHENGTTVTDMWINFADESKVVLFEEFVAAFSNEISSTSDRVIVRDVQNQTTARTQAEAVLRSHDNTEVSAEEKRIDVHRRIRNKVQDIQLVAPLAADLIEWQADADKNKEATGKRFTDLIALLNRTPPPQRSVFLSALDAENGISFTVVDGNIDTTGITVVTRQATLRFTRRVLTSWAAILNA